MLRRQGRFGFGLPHHIAGLGIQRHHAAVQQGHEHLAISHGHAARLGPAADIAEFERGGVVPQRPAADRVIGLHLSPGVMMYMTPLTTIGVTSKERAMPVWMMATGEAG